MYVVTVRKLLLYRDAKTQKTFSLSDELLLSHEKELGGLSKPQI